jgi:ElaB/YqjD/DUF883 family membrane-anchored ribosome-binding protein
MNTSIKNQPADKARDAANQTVDKAKDTMTHAGEAAHQAAHAVGQKAGQAAQAVGQAAQAVGHSAEQAAHAVGHKAEDATAAVGSGFQTLADKVRQQGPDHGMLGKATQTVASSLDDAGKYIEDKNLSGMVDDVSGLIKRNPIPALLVGIGVGFLIGRTLRS